MSNDKTAFDLLVELIALQVQKQAQLAPESMLTLAEIDRRTHEIKDRLTGDGR